MNWLSKNYFKLGVLVAVFVLLYYLYLIFVMPVLQQEDAAKNCSVQGAIFSEQFQTESKQENSNIISFITPQYHYSKQRSACLSENGYVFPDHGGTGTYMVVTDINSNQQILQSVKNIYEQIDPSNGVVTYDEFTAQAPSIMSN
jgi:hypothetical protein